VLLVRCAPARRRIFQPSEQFEIAAIGGDLFFGARPMAQQRLMCDPHLSAACRSSWPTIDGGMRFLVALRLMDARRHGIDSIVGHQKPRFGIQEGLDQGAGRRALRELGHRRRARIRRCFGTLADGHQRAQDGGQRRRNLGRLSRKHLFGAPPQRTFEAAKLGVCREGQHAGIAAALP
jgi:hypothetical protein